MRKVIAIDQDQVLADLLTPWVAEYNDHHKDTLALDAIKCWDISKYVKCGPEIYSYLTYNLFRNLPVIPDSQRVVKKLMEKYDVFVVTATTGDGSLVTAKLEWLAEHFDFIPRSNIVLCGHKSIIRADFMIDDGVHNLETFKGEKILFDAPHNRNETRYFRAMNWEEIEKFLA